MQTVDINEFQAHYKLATINCILKFAFYANERKERKKSHFELVSVAAVQKLNLCTIGQLNVQTERILEVKQSREGGPFADLRMCRD